ncbi:hypothetical protein ZHAS_00006778 [Anopheles sinensis]|uniref:Uncharacterized protein n=1 Tax=Anopheles sinensis TaxID=74873 RepID=A0A084VN12_ANOSI|nr:hypothetical protein ZHAS_00006778 [Anopheles sinensis]
MKRVTSGRYFCINLTTMVCAHSRAHQTESMITHTFGSSIAYGRGFEAAARGSPCWSTALSRQTSQQAPLPPLAGDETIMAHAHLPPPSLLARTLGSEPADAAGSGRAGCPELCELQSAVQSVVGYSRAYRSVQLRCY